jgi:hypothetical protein
MTDTAGAGTARSSFLDRLGPRATRRPQPRASIALAGAGCALAVAGVLTLAGDAGVSDDGGFNRAPGIILSLLVVGAGLLVLQLRDQGPLATAGSVAVAAGTPAAIGFLVLGGGDGRLDTAITLSALAWLATYVVGPGRGRPVFLGLAAYGVWSTILQMVGAGGTTSLLALTPFGWFAFGESCEYDSFTGSSDCTSMGPFGMGFDQPDWAALGLVSLAVGLGYFLLSQRLDRSGRHGMSTPFVFVGLLAVVQGVIAMSIELEDAHGAGAVILAVGVALAGFGGSTGRRFTTWFGGAASALGVGLVVLPDVDSASVGGLLLLGSGLVVVVVTHLVAEQLGEPDELAVDPAPDAAPSISSERRALVAEVLEPEPQWAEDPTLLELEPLQPAPPAKKAAKKAVKLAVAK